MPAPRLADPGYVGVHQRLRRERGPAKDHTCACGSPASDWAYDGKDADERRDERGTYSLNLEHYVPMCRSCHWTHDRDGKCRKGHPLTEQNAYVHRGVTLCRTCRRDAMRAHRARASNQPGKAAGGASSEKKESDTYGG